MKTILKKKRNEKKNFRCLSFFILVKFQQKTLFESQINLFDHQKIQKKKKTKTEKSVDFLFQSPKLSHNNEKKEVQKHYSNWMNPNLSKF